MSEGAENFDPRTQVVTLIAADGVTTIPVSIPYIDWLYLQGYASEINYGSQIGASFIMLLVMLLMTPRNRFARTPTLINLAGLVVNLVRCVLLSLFFTSSWMDFYTTMSGDVTNVSPSDFRISVVATAFNIPVLIVMETALAIQAWSMIQLWASWYKWSAATISVLVIIASIALKVIDTVVQCRYIVDGGDLPRWPRVADLALSAASICWFCFLFIIRLVIHMYTNRTILPSARGLSAMEVLVMTNGILMLVPVLFAGLEWGTFVNFEAASLTYTSVFIVLPLGTLVAQRISNPRAFILGRSSNDNLSGASSQKHPFLKTCRSDTMTPNSHTGVTTHVSSNSSPEKTAPFCSDFDHSIEDEMERGVRVDRKIEHREKIML